MNTNKKDVYKFKYFSMYDEESKTIEKWINKHSKDYDVEDITPYSPSYNEARGVSVLLKLKPIIL